jgi:SpoVK/Ycf46/Vps4 family AAA+-type ATPase
LAQQIAARVLQASELTFEKDTGQISPVEYGRRFQDNAAEMGRRQREFSALPADRQAEVRRQTNAIVTDGLTRLRANWASYLAAHPSSGAGRAVSAPRAPSAAASALLMPTGAPTPKVTSGYGWWLLLGVPLAGGVGYLLWRGGRNKPLALALRTATPAVPAGAIGEPSPLPAMPRGAAASSGPQLVQSSLAALPASLTDEALRKPVDGNTRERLLAQVQAKYQATITAALDQLTAVQLELQQNEQLPAAVRSGLQKLGSKLHAETLKQISRQLSSPGKVLADVVLLQPLWRMFRGGLLRKVIAAVVAWSLLSGAIRTLARGDYPPVIGGYLAIVAVLFFFRWRLQSKGVMTAIERSAACLKTPRLLYAYAQQLPSGKTGVMTYEVTRISSASDQPVVDESTLTNQPDERGLGACFLWLDNAAVYRVEGGGTSTLLGWQASHALMTSFSAVLTQALNAHAAELQPLLEPVRGYGELKWRERQQRAAVPRLEQLLANATKLASIWKPLAVSDAVFQFFIRRIDLFNLRDKATPAGLLLYGYPGNGKEFLARKVAESVFAQFVKPPADQLASAQGIRELWAAHSGGAAVVFFIDYADQVFARAGDQEGAGREATLAWLEEWSRHEPNQSGIWVILSAQSDQNLHPRILAHVGSSKIEIAPPDTAGRLLVLANACEENQLPAAVPRWLVEESAGASVRELRDIVREARLQSVPDAPTEAQWRAAMRSVRGADAAYRDEKKTWERLVLPADTKAQLQRAARILREAERYRDKQVNVPNILLYGPPGTGKTDIARTFANEGGVKFIAAATADLKAQYVGQSAHLVRQLFAKARASAPCVLFIDEIETVAAKRGSPNADAFTQDIVTEMLAQMDGARTNDRPIIVLAATNLPEQIDAAILNRFTSRIEIALPDEAARKELLIRLIRERPTDPALDVDEIAVLMAKRLNRKSGRDLVMLVNRAMERAVAASDSPDDVRLTRELLVAEAVPQGKEVGEADLQKIWSQIVLPADVKQDLLDKIRMFNRADKAAPRGLLLYGPPGTGKTEIARRIADSASCFFMALKGPDLKAGYVGQSGERVQKVWEQARSRGRCVIFVDECEGVFARRGGGNADAASEELVQAFLAEWDGVGTEDQRVWVVGATNRRDLLDDAIVSRFGAAVQIDLPGPAERLQILQLELAKLERLGEIPEFLGAATAGLSGRNLSMVAREVCTLAARNDNQITDAMWREVLQRHTKAGSEAVDEGARWDALILAGELLEKLKTLCEILRHAEEFKRQGFDVPKGALLYGPPGTGKTQIARTLANESGLPFIAATTAELKAGFVGQSGQKVRELFERARGRAPCILFIDEMETVAPARGGGSADSFTGEIVTQLLQELDGVRASPRHVFVLAATNLPDAIDAAILSRFEEKLEIGAPEIEQRQRLFRLFLNKQRVDFDRDAIATELAERTPNLGGRDIRSLIQRASQRAIRRAVAAGTPQSVTLTREDLVNSVATRS